MPLAFCSKYFYSSLHALVYQTLMERKMKAPFADMQTPSVLLICSKENWIDLTKGLELMRLSTVEHRRSESLTFWSETFKSVVTNVHEVQAAMAMLFNVTMSARLKEEISKWDHNTREILCIVMSDIDIHSMMSARATGPQVIVPVTTINDSRSALCIRVPLPDGEGTGPLLKAAIKCLNVQCDNCSRVAKLKLCGSCYNVGYCSISCQRSHWNTHKTSCVKRSKTAVYRDSV